MKYYTFQSPVFSHVVIVIREKSYIDANFMITELLGEAMASKFTCVAVYNQSPAGN